MKSFYTITRILQSTLLAAALLTLLGCEGDGDAPLPGSTMLINPAEYTFTTTTLDDSVCLASYQDVAFKINAYRETGEPLGEAPLTIVLTHSGNTSSSQVVFMYADTNNNLVIDANEPIVNEPGDPGYAISTDNQGETHVNVRFLTHCGTYAGTVGVYGDGSLVGFADFEITVEEETATTP